MSFRKLLLAGATLAVSTAALAAPASASIIDRPHFKVLGVVIVWAANDTDGSTPIATDFVIGDASDTDLIAADGRTVVTGSLTATPDAAAVASAGFAALDLNGTEIGDGDGDLDLDDTFAAFDVTTATIGGAALTYNSSFYVASNTAFGINAEVQSSTVTGDFALADVGYALSSTQTGTDGALTFGGNANDVGATGAFSAPADLGAFAPGANQVFESTQRTAASVGNIVSQSVRFDAEYTLGAGAGYDLSQGAGSVEAQLAYTVYVP